MSSVENGKRRSSTISFSSPRGIDIKQPKPQEPPSLQSKSFELDVTDEALIRKVIAKNKRQRRSRTTLHTNYIPNSPPEHPAASIAKNKRRISAPPEFMGLQEPTARKSPRTRGGTTPPSRNLDSLKVGEHELDALLSLLHFSSAPKNKSEAANGKFSLELVRQCPSRTVYQRILKPHPVVKLSFTGGLRNNGEDLYVQVFLIRADNCTDVSSFLDGQKIVRIPSSDDSATFRKLKMLQTSRRAGCEFCLKFQLKKRAHTNVYTDVKDAFVVSSPIQVFSHTQYLNEAEKQSGGRRNNKIPIISEILPPCGRTCGTRVVIIGRNFQKGSGLVVEFGRLKLVPEFHESCCLIINLPKYEEGIVNVNVSNDGKNYGNKPVLFKVYDDSKYKLKSRSGVKAERSNGIHNHNNNDSMDVG